jgi:hypothetical protein
VARPGGPALAAVIYSRNHDGYVRQRQLAALLGSDEPWAAPFIVALLGEYVIEICLEIERFALTEFAARPAMRQSMSAFFAANRPFIELTRQRAISYRLGWTSRLGRTSRLSGRG